MQMKLFVSFFFLFFIAVFSAKAQSTNVSDWSTHKAKKWMKKGTWAQGLSIKPHKSVDAKVFARQYFTNKKYWDEAFSFLKGNNLQQLQKGKYPIDGDNVYASVTTDSSKNFDKTNWESHHKYIDLQYVIDGEETMGVWPVAKATVSKPYDEKKDVANYNAEGKFYPATNKAFFLFFPTNAHRPNITPGGNKVVKKIVIKIRAAE